MASGSCQSSFDPSHLSSYDEEYLTHNNVAATTGGRSNRTACLLTVARLYLNSPPTPPKNRGQINPNLNDYHSDPMVYSSTFWIPDIPNWWSQQEETHSKYAELSNVACDIFSIITHGVGVVASFSLGPDVFGWRLTNSTGETHRKKVIVKQFTWANNQILASTDPELDTTNIQNNSDAKKEAEERNLHRMAKVHDFLDMWQASQNLCATQKESQAQDKQITALGYISDTEEIVKASWSLFQHDGAAAFKLAEWSPLPPPFSVKDLPGGQTQILNIRQIRRIIHRAIERDEDSSPECILDTEPCLIWNGYLDNRNDSEDHCTVCIESDMEQYHSIEDLESPEQRNKIPARNVPRLIWPIGKSKGHAEIVLVTVDAI
jgi:hypothetical protein